MKKKIKKIAVLGLVAIVLILTGLRAYIYFTQDEKINPVKTIKLVDTAEPPIQLIAHGGLSATEPENTIYAFEAAGRAGFTMVELPIHETRDGVLVVMQDNSISKMTDGKGKIKNYTYYDLLKFNIDNGANIDKYQKVKISTLEQVLDTCANYAVNVEIEINEGNKDSLNLLARIIKERDLAGGCIVSSSNMDNLLEMKKLCPTVDEWYVVDELTDEEMTVCKENKDITVNFNANNKKNTDDRIEKLKAAGLKSACWTVDDTEVLERMHRLGIRYFTTNCIVPR